MQKCNGHPISPLILESNNSHNIKEILLLHQAKFTAYIQQIGLNIQNYEKITNLQSKSTTIITLKTTCFKVDFNDNSVKIAPLK